MLGAMAAASPSLATVAAVVDGSGGPPFIDLPPVAAAMDEWLVTGHLTFGPALVSHRDTAAVQSKRSASTASVTTNGIPTTGAAEVTCFCCCFCGVNRCFCFCFCWCCWREPFTAPLPPPAPLVGVVVTAVVGVATVVVALFFFASFPSPSFTPSPSPFPFPFTSPPSALTSRPCKILNKSANTPSRPAYRVASSSSTMPTLGRSRGSALPGSTPRAASRSSAAATSRASRNCEVSTSRSFAKYRECCRSWARSTRKARRTRAALGGRGGAWPVSLALVVVVVRLAFRAAAVAALSVLFDVSNVTSSRRSPVGSMRITCGRSCCVLLLLLLLLPVLPS